MRFSVDEDLENLRYKAAAAIEYGRTLDLTIDGAGAQVMVESLTRQSPTDSLGKLVVSFMVPNEFRLLKLEIPDDNTQTAHVETYPTDQFTDIITLG